MSEDNIGARIRIIRGSVPQDEFARRHGVNRNTLGRYEKGTNDPNASFLASLIDAYGVDANWLLLGVGEPPKPELTPREAALLDNYRHIPSEEAKRSIETTSAYLAQRSREDEGMKDAG
ncbi:MAG: helix-turn-helix domain-containing protein [Desulfovibrio sp.]